MMIFNDTGKKLIIELEDSDTAQERNLANIKFDELKTLLKLIKHG